METGFSARVSDELRDKESFTEDPLISATAGESLARSSSVFVCV